MSYFCENRRGGYDKGKSQFALFNRKKIFLTTKTDKMTEIIKQFIEKAQSMGKRNFFNKGLSTEEIAEYQKQLQEKFGITLPPLMVEFYQQFNGGCFADADWSEEDLDNPKERGGILWNSNTFIPLEKIVSCEEFDIQDIKEETGRIFFPIIHTNGQGVLVMENGKEPVFDAFHEMLYCPELWGEVYLSFEALLKAYIKTEGDIKTIG